MRNILLQFDSLETLARFTRKIEGGYFANIPKLTIKGTFLPEEIDFALENCQATIKDKEGDATCQEQPVLSEVIL
jgi:hypothetical protein